MDAGAGVGDAVVELEKVGSDGGHERDQCTRAEVRY
jgi:hypothetical protein